MTEEVVVPRTHSSQEDIFLSFFHYFVLSFMGFVFQNRNLPATGIRLEEWEGDEERDTQNRQKNDKTNKPTNKRQNKQANKQTHMIAPSSKQRKRKCPPPFRLISEPNFRPIRSEDPIRPACKTNKKMGG